MVVGQFRIWDRYAEGVGQFQPRVASTLGISGPGSVTLKALAKAWLQVANAFSVFLSGLSYPKVEATLMG
jgi:hypothetical protein